MENKNDNWKLKYDKYKTMNFDQIIAKREEEVAKKEAKGEDTTKYKESTEKFKKVQANMPKIENLANYLNNAKTMKEKLEGQKKQIEDLKTAPTKMDDMAEKMETIEKQNKELETKIDDVDKRMKTCNPEEKKKLEIERKALMDEYGKNQTKYSKYQDKYLANRELLEKNAGQTFPTVEEIDKKIQEQNKTIDQCNLMCSELIEGKPMNEVMKELKDNATKQASDNSEHENIGRENTASENPVQEKPVQEKPAQENSTQENQEEETNKKITLRDRFMNFLSKHPKIANFANKISGNKFVPELEAASEAKVDVHEEEVKSTEPAENENSFRDEIKVEPEKEEKEESVEDILQYQLLEAIAEHGEKSTVAQKIASQIKLQKYVQEKSGIVIGTKSDSTRYKNEAYQALPKNSGMKEALAAQDKIATHGVKQKEDDEMEL